MCGIAGGTFSDLSLLKRMTDTLEHRGPDGSGALVQDGVALGHRRLAIIDLSETGAQPMVSNELTITFNGEIYNFDSLRSELKAFGHQFVGRSDTEVILKAYQQWGSECTQRFNGMWAFVIHDRKNQELFFSRDRFGIKPLYYVLQGSAFYFASEIKAFRPLSFLQWDIDRVGMNQYFYQKYTSAPNTMYAEIKMVAPGHQGTFDLKSKKLNISEYYSIEKEVAIAEKYSQKELNERIQKYLIDAVEIRMISDVPLGSFLSGGLDSSSIAAIAQEKLSKEGSRLRTFSLGFEDASYDESSFASQVASHLGTEHFQATAHPNTELWSALQKHADEPFGDSSIIPTTLLSGMTREHVTVALSGDAGDELFGGYDTHKAWLLAQSVPNVFKGALKGFSSLAPVDYKSKVSWSFKLQRFSRDLETNPLRRHLDWMATFTDESRQKLLGDQFIPSSEIMPLDNLDPNDFRSIQYLDIRYYLPGDILRKVDLASMFHSLEARVPFLDYRIVPLALALKRKDKLDLLDQKIWLKNFARPKLPKSILKRSKRGFTVPVNNWLQLRSDAQRTEKWLETCPDSSRQFLKEIENRPEAFGRERWLLEQFVGSIE